MVETAAFLVDEVLPAAPYRQWVLTVPFRLRLLLARRPELVSAVLQEFLRGVGALQRGKARALGVRGGQAGAVTFVQRFGDALNLHVHFHAVSPDGVFTEGEDGRAVFHKVPGPTDEEVLQVCLRTRERVLRLLEKEGEFDGAPDAMAQLQAQALQGSLGFVRAEEPPVHKRRCAMVEGFSVHANVHLHANDREGLERLCRYGARPNFSLSRLGRLSDGRVTYQLKKPLANEVGTLVLPPLKFLARLAAMVPPPRAHLVRYHGVFAPNAKLRDAVVRTCPKAQESEVLKAKEEPNAEATLNRLDWASLLRRVYAVDVLECPKCLGRMKVLAFLTEGRVVKEVLGHLKLPVEAPACEPARYEPEQLAMEAPVAYVSDVSTGYTAPDWVHSQGPPGAMRLAA
jgi:hypothetical protein